MLHYYNGPQMARARRLANTGGPGEGLILQIRESVSADSVAQSENSMHQSADALPLQIR